MDKTQFRIIDANFNRAREACRVIEDFCRFALDSAVLSARTKQLRHELSAVTAKLDQALLLAARNTSADVGIGQKVPGQMNRIRLYDSFTAACKRLPEALRVIEETIKTLDTDAAERIEKLRYTSYTLEKDIVLFYSAVEKFDKVRLYVIITNEKPAEILNLTHKCIAGGADCLQLRAKQLLDDQLFATACEFVKLCKEAGVIAVINDRIDIAVAAGADGVHLGQNDLPVGLAQKLTGPAFITGKSTHSMTQLEKAVEELPTYVALGPVFATKTKPKADAVGLDYVTKATEFLRDKGMCHVAIGGINTENVDKVIRAGARTIAVCSAVTHSKDVITACRTLKSKINGSQP